MNCPKEFVPSSRDDWRKWNADDGSRKRRKSSGITPKHFHNLSITSPERSQSMQKIKRTLQKGRQLVKTHDIIKKCISLKDLFQEFKGKTSYQEFGLQADAFKALYDIQQQFENTPVTSNNNGPMWSMVPRVFAVEKSAGKRRYIVCNEGRFMHKYWRNCEPYARHHYEVIKEKTPCRLYFGESDFPSQFLLLYHRSALTLMSACIVTFSILMNW